MNEQTLDSGERALEERSRALFHESVDGLDMATRSRLTQARHAAIAAAERSPSRAWLPRFGVLKPALGVTAAAVLGIGLWLGSPAGHFAGPATRAAVAADSLEDLDMVAASDEGSGDAMEMLQDDVDFYDWADKAANSEPAA
jgi:hypothetical protein